MTVERRFDRFKNMAAVAALAVGSLFSGKKPEMRIPSRIAHSTKYLGYGGAWFSQPIPKSGMQKEQQPRPCLQCGKKTKHSKPFCSAEHLYQWRADNPGNGRYVHEKWERFDNARLYKDLGRDTDSVLHVMIPPGDGSPGNDHPYMIKELGNEFTLLKFDGEAFQIVSDFITDHLINAKRAAHQHMTGQPITVH